VGNAVAVKTAGESAAALGERGGRRLLRSGRGASPARCARRGGGDRRERKGHHLRTASSGEEWGNHCEEKALVSGGAEGGGK
jgi:hypothetical protein